MIPIQKAGDGPMGNGMWRLWRRGDPKRVILSCPRCGRTAMLDHEIAADGTVTPSVECPHPGCFHGMVRLESWDA